jgi:hypothetical protein
VAIAAPCADESMDGPIDQCSGSGAGAGRIAGGPGLRGGVVDPAASAHLRRSVTGEPGRKWPGPAGDGDVLHRRSVHGRGGSNR